MRSRAALPPQRACSAGPGRSRLAAGAAAAAVVGGSYRFALHPGSSFGAGDSFLRTLRGLRCRRTAVRRDHGVAQGAGRPGSPGEIKVQVETREDEEQNVKLTEILELLVAAGYFRARIKGLSPFDKIATLVPTKSEGMKHTKGNIGKPLQEKAEQGVGERSSVPREKWKAPSLWKEEALSEKIVSVLPRMKCPHQLEPHQIQGMDFIHIFPVVQWLVKRAIETKEEMGDYIRCYSVSQFQRTYSLPEDDDFIKRKEKAIKTVVDLSDAYKPRRKYKRQRAAEELLDEESRIHTTLLEYGR
eukprot:bmy_21869T0